MIAFLWDDDENVDTEGNAVNPASQTWTNLYLETRDTPFERVHIEEYKFWPLTLTVKSDNKHLAARIAYLLAEHTKGKVALIKSGPYQPPESMLTEMGPDFDLQEVFARFKNSPFFYATLDNPYPNLGEDGRSHAVNYQKSKLDVFWRERLLTLAARLFKIGLQ